MPLQHLGAFLEGLAHEPDGPDTASGADAGKGTDAGTGTGTGTGTERESLRSVDDPGRTSIDMDDTISLRLVIELVNDASGNTRVNLHRFDRSVDYGPVSVYDLPAIIEALAPTHDPTRQVVVDLTDDTSS